MKKINSILKGYFLAYTALFLNIAIPAQTPDTLSQLPKAEKYLTEVNSLASKLNNKLDKESAKILKSFQKQEAKLRTKLARSDSAKAKEIFGGSDEKYAALQNRIKQANENSYIPQLDSLLTSLKFIQANPQLLKQTGDASKQISSALGKVKELNSKFQSAEELRRFIKERKQYLKEQLEKMGFAKKLMSLNKKVYYYSEQIKSFKEIVNDPKKAEKKILELLVKTKLFRDFMQKHCLLANFFRMPGDPADPTYLSSLSGLQTRAQVNTLIQQQLSAGGPNAQSLFQQNVQAAQSQLNQLKNKVLKSGGGAGNADMPEGFKPNNQKTKTFLQRLEYGINIQSQKLSNFFPVTSDFGLSLGYKLNDKSVIGVGASYKLGWGRGWNHIDLSSEGLGLRSYIDWKVKGSFWISGGYEKNYRTAFKDFNQLRDLSAWQQSGLIGISKQVSMKTKLFKKTNIRLLWDFLSYQQIPQTQPFVFRIGYNF